MPPKIILQNEPATIGPAGLQWRSSTTNTRSSGSATCRCKPLLCWICSPKEPRAKFTDGNYYWPELVGRLRHGVSIAQAQAALAPRFLQWVETTAKNATERADLPALVVKAGGGGLDYLRRQYSKPLYVPDHYGGLSFDDRMRQYRRLAAGTRRVAAP